MKTLILSLALILFASFTPRDFGYLVVVEHNNRIVIHEKLPSIEQADSILNLFFPIQLDSIMGEHYCILENDSVQFYCEYKKMKLFTK